MSFALKVSIYVTPGAKNTQIAGMQGNALRLRLAARPVDGAANAALLAWAAQTFDVGKKQVELLHGTTSRQKVLQILFSSETEMQAARTLLQQIQQIASNPKGNA